MPATPPVQYALGRGTIFQIRYPVGTGNIINLCISDGSIELTTDQIEINNNCYSGWKVKLPGNKSGTINVTGFVASDSTVGANSQIQLLSWFGNIVEFECEAYDGQANAAQALFFNAQGVVTSCRISVSPDDAVRAELTIDISGQPVGYASLARST
jgi:hypothetical protein